MILNIEIKVPHTREAIKAEQRHFLFCTRVGKLVVFLVWFLCGILITVASMGSSLENGMAFLITALISFLLAAVFLALGYFWVNNGGHVSNFFEDLGARRYKYDINDRTLVIDDLGVTKILALKEIHIRKKVDRIYIVCNSSVYSLPNTKKANQFIAALE